MNLFNALGTTDAIVFLVYLCVIVAIGFIVSNSVKDDKDFTAAGQNMSLTLMIGTCLASFFGAYTGSGGLDIAGEIGLTAITVNLGSALGWFIMGLMAKNMRRSGALSYPEYISKLFGKDARTVSSGASMIFLVGQVGGQFAACGTLCVLLNICNFTTGVVVGGILIVLLTVSGGLVGVAITDTVQQVFITILCVGIIPVVAVTQAGGVGAIVDYTMATAPHKLSFLRGGDFGRVLALFLSCMLPFTCEPAYAQRIFAAKDEKTAFWGTHISWFVSFLLTIPLYACILAAPMLYGEGFYCASFIPMTLQTFMPPVIKGLGVAAFCSLLLTTGDTMLLAESSIFTNDIYPMIKPKTDPKTMLRLGRICVVVMGIIAIIMSLWLKRVSTIMLLFNGAYGSCVFPPVLIANLKGSDYLDKKIIAPCMAIVMVLVLLVDLIPAFPTEGVFIGIPLHVILLIVATKMSKKKEVII